MTYTFKLARRLAISRDFGMMPLLLVLGACAAGDAAAPDIPASTEGPTAEQAGPEPASSKPALSGAQIRVAPRQMFLRVNQAARFRAVDRHGKAADLEVIWAASGGTIRRDGTFRASTPGTYKVVGRGHGRGGADTSVVVVVDTPAPTTIALTVTPSTGSLSAGATLAFKAEARLSDSTTVPAAVVWSAVGGTITSGGLFTAGTTAGSYRVIARDSASGLADTAAVAVASPPPAASNPPAPSTGTAGTGVPFGPFGLMTSGGTSLPFTVSMEGAGASTLVTQINQARARGVKLVLNMTGGAHKQYLDADGVFSMAKWIAKQETYNTPTIRAAVAAAVADGTVIGNVVMDEPHNVSPENSWGPPGTLTKVRVDSMCGYTKQIFPTLPVGVWHSHVVFEPEKSYRVCEFLGNQYAAWKGDVTKFREGALAYGRRDGMAMLFSLNILDGGLEIPGCPQPETGGVGTYGKRCRMTAAQVREFAEALAPGGCGLLMWRYDATFMADPANVQAFKDVAARLATLPARSCRRA